MKHFYFAGGSTYVLPNVNTVVLGGTTQKNCWDTSVSQQVRVFLGSCRVDCNSKATLLIVQRHVLAKVAAQWPNIILIRALQAAIFLDDCLWLPVIHVRGLSSVKHVS